MSSVAPGQKIHRLADHRNASSIQSESAVRHNADLHRRYGTEAIFQATLHRCLIGLPPREIDFFVNARRFALMQTVIGERLKQRPLRILNAASGPFALEFYIALDGAEIDSFDVDQKLVALYQALTIRKLITPCTFRTMDVGAFEPRKLYDLVIINDLFYSKHIDFFEVIEKFAASVAPGGTLYFDLQDKRAAPLWWLLGKGNKTRRYDLSRVQSSLEALGFTIDRVEPSLGIKGASLDGIARRFLWRRFGIANNFAFAATRTAP